MRTFRAKFCNLRHFAPCWLWHVHPKSEWNQYESVLSTSIFSRVLVLAAGPEELHRVVFSFIAHHSIIDPCWLRDIAGLAALIEVALYKIECHTPMEDLLCIQYTVSPFMHSVHDSLHSSHQSRCETISPDWNNLLLQQPPKDLPPEKKKSVLQDPIYTSWRGQQLHHRSFHCTMSQKVVHVFYKVCHVACLGCKVLEVLCHGHGQGRQQQKLHGLTSTTWKIPDKTDKTKTDFPCLADLAESSRQPTVRMKNMRMRVK